MQVQKVTDSAKRVTDPVMLAALARQGIDSDYVELFQDYGRAVKGVSSPYIKHYRDLKSAKRFAVISQLPMVDHEGSPVEAGWQATSGGFEAKSNLFTVKVSGLETEISVRNDQPDGRKAGDKLSFKPQVFFDNAEVSCLPSPTLLSADPVNGNYSNNVLEWDYGVCKRRLRIIEGRLLGSWVFDKTPKGEVRIKYNQSGDFKLKLGQFKINDDEELILTTAFENPAFGYPFTVSDSSIFYPDAHTETTSVDGFVQRNANATWANARGGNGDAADDTNADSWNVCLGTGTLSNNWLYFYRALFAFDTSALPDTCIITDAVLSIYGTNKIDNGGWGLAFGLVQGVSASNTALAASDFQANTYTTRLATDISYAGYSITGYNNFTLNAAGKSNISKTGVSKFCVKQSADIDNTEPAWAANKTFGAYNYMAEQGTGYKPKLVVTYTVGEAKTSGDSGAGTESTCERQLGVTEAGVGVEAALPAAAVILGDEGSGSEVGGLLKALFSQDKGGGADSFKILTGKAGYDLRLHSNQGQVSIPHKEVNL